MINKKVLLEKLQTESDKWSDVYNDSKSRGRIDLFVGGMSDAYEGAISIVKGLTVYSIEEIRNKAITDFAERIKKEAADGGWNCHSVYSGGCDYISCEKCESSFLKEIDEIAEQMKAGAE